MHRRLPGGVVGENYSENSDVESGRVGYGEMVCAAEGARAESSLVNPPERDRIADTPGGFRVLRVVA